MTTTGTFLDVRRIRDLTETPEPTERRVRELTGKALELRGLNTGEAAELLAVRNADLQRLLVDAARTVKREIYGSRMVLFAPLYTGNFCSNNCLYCGFRKENHELRRVRLSRNEIEAEVTALLREGHKRLLLLCGESDRTTLDDTIEAIRAAYGVRWNGHGIRRINVEIAPLTIEEFRTLSREKIGTYTCFQETYDPERYAAYHPSGPKADYRARLEVMDRAMQGGIDDVGIGALFGLADYRFDVLALLEHAAHLERTWGCGPHTVSVPRIEPAAGAPLTERVPCPVSDEQFRSIVAVLRLALPYTGIILSTREPAALRTELFACGVSQASAGSRTAPGGYAGSANADPDKYAGDPVGIGVPRAGELRAGVNAAEAAAEGQFSLGDRRSLEEVISSMVDDGYIPSFCTGCYRRGRTGKDFMDLAKPGLIKEFCFPNGLSSFAEYLVDFASSATQAKGFALIDRLAAELPTGRGRAAARETVIRIREGERDVYR